MAGMAVIGFRRPIHDSDDVVIVGIGLFFEQKTAYEISSRDWSSDVCSSDLIAVMAAAYAAVVPLLEVPSGILADRWSRNQIMVCASVALLASSLLGGLSTNVPPYIAAALILGVYFALN